MKPTSIATLLAALGCAVSATAATSTADQAGTDISANGSGKGTSANGSGKGSSADNPVQLSK